MRAGLLGKEFGTGHWGTRFWDDPGTNQICCGARPFWDLPSHLSCFLEHLQLETKKEGSRETTCWDRRAGRANRDHLSFFKASHTSPLEHSLSSRDTQPHCSPESSAPGASRELGGTHVPELMTLSFKTKAGVRGNFRSAGKSQSGKSGLWYFPGQGSSPEQDGAVPPQSSRTLSFTQFSGLSAS